MPSPNDYLLKDITSLDICPRHQTYIQNYRCHISSYMAHSKPNMYKIRLLMLPLKSHFFHSHSHLSKLQLHLLYTLKTLKSFLNLLFFHTQNQTHQNSPFAFFFPRISLQFCLVLLPSLLFPWSEQSSLSCINAITLFSSLVSAFTLYGLILAQKLGLPTWYRIQSSNPSGSKNSKDCLYEELH